MTHWPICGAPSGNWLTTPTCARTKLIRIAEAVS